MKNPTRNTTENAGDATNTDGSERILLVEDDFAIRNSLEFALRRAGYQIRTLDNGHDAARAVEEFRPDLVLLDVMLPGLSGLEVCEELRRVDRTTAIIIISALGEESDRIAGLRLGADDYVSKPFSLDELLERVRANLRRLPLRREEEVSASIPGTRLEFDGGNGERALVIDPKRREVCVGGKAQQLRAKEFVLLYTLARHAGEAMSREQLAREVWGQEHISSSRTIDIHIRRLRALLGEAGLAAWLQTMHGYGYRFEPSDDAGDEPSDDASDEPSDEVNDGAA